MMLQKATANDSRAGSMAAQPARGPAASLLPSFPIARLRFEAVAAQPYFTPSFAGSVLRGTFGHALRRLVCMTGQSDCAACPLYRRCPYPEVFAPPPLTQPVRGRDLQQPPVPYVIEPPAIGRRWIEEGEVLRFHILLIGPAVARIPHVVEAMRRALAHGLGRGRTRFILQRVRAAPPRPFRTPRSGESATASAGGGPSDKHETPSLPLFDFCDPEAETAPLEAAIVPPAAIARAFPGPMRGPSTDRKIARIRIRHITPLRLQRAGDLLDHRRLRPRDLLIAIWRRWTFLEAAYGTPEQADRPLADCLETAEQITARRDDLFWWDWTRRSSRQRRTMTIGGVRGSWTWEGKGLAELLPLLTLGAVLHVGKETSFGFGRYRIENAD